jgi:anti-anti-sigma regulatory factor
MNEDETNTVLKLPRTLDFGAAEGFLETMRKRLQDNPRLRVDASGVEVLTVPCIQIILSALISIERPSEEYINAFQDLGIDCSERQISGIDAEAPQDVSADAVSDPHRRKNLP